MKKLIIKAGEEALQRDLTEQEQSQRAIDEVIGNKQTLLESLAKEFQKRFYTGFPVQDSQGIDAVIQFRHDRDRANIETVMQGAMILKEIDPAAVVSFRTEDNQDRQFLATDFLTNGLTLFSERQAVLKSYWSKKDEVESVDPIEGNAQFFVDYDLLTGWPE